MKKPTLDILDAITPAYNQYQTLPDLTRHKEYTSKFSLNNQAWNNYFATIAELDFDWHEIKYTDVVTRAVNIDDVVPASIGIYLFVVRPLNLVNLMPKFVYYVGIAGANGSGRSLNERLKDYFANSKIKKRDAVQILIFKHYENLFINYSSITLPNGTSLEEIEKSLIGFFGTHILANRDDIPVELQPQAKAFNI